MTKIPTEIKRKKTSTFFLSLLLSLRSAGGWQEREEKENRIKEITLERAIPPFPVTHSGHEHGEKNGEE